MPKLTAADKAKIEERRKSVAANLLAGLTMRQIADALGVSVGTVHSDWKAIKADWKKTQIMLAEERILLQLRRTDQMINAIYPQAVTDGSLSHIQRVQALMEQQDRYIGIGAQQVKVSDPEGKPLAPAVVIMIPDNGRGDTHPDAKKEANPDTADWPATGATDSGTG